MRKSDLLRRPVRDIELRGGRGVSDLVAQMEAGGGFTAKKLGVGADILRAMFRDPRCVTFLSFPAALVATGVRGVLRTLVQRKLVDVVITTCGTADHDLARTWKDYYHGEFEMDDVELHRLGVNRLGNVLVPNESYGIVGRRTVTKPATNPLAAERAQIPDHHGARIRRRTPMRVSLNRYVPSGAQNKR